LIYPIFRQGAVIQPRNAHSRDGSVVCLLRIGKLFVKNFNKNGLDFGSSRRRVNWKADELGCLQKQFSAAFMGSRAKIFNDATFSQPPRDASC